SDRAEGSSTKSPGAILDGAQRRARRAEAQDGPSNLSGRANFRAICQSAKSVPICSAPGEGGAPLAYARLRRARWMDSEVINRLLVVDDEAAQVEALCRTLEDEGYSVKGFTGTGPALAALR